MGILNNNLKKILGEVHDNQSLLANPTGFTLIDIVHAGGKEYFNPVNPDLIDVKFSTFFQDLIKNDMRKNNYSGANIQVVHGGITNTPNTMVGISGAGKSTQIMQMGSGMIDFIREAYGKDAGSKVDLLFFNVETHTNIKHIRASCGYDHISNDLFAETITPITGISELNEILKIIYYAKHKKEELKKGETEFRTGIRGIKGNNIKSTTPTIVVLDSLNATTIPIDLNIDEKDGTVKSSDGKDKNNGSMIGSKNTDGMTVARYNKDFIMRVKAICAENNFILLIINHLKVKPQLGMFDRPEVVLPCLKPGEMIDGGKEQIYQSSSLWKLTTGPTIEYDKANAKSTSINYGPHIKGRVVWSYIAKNKSGPENIKFPFVFDMTGKSFMPEMGDLHYLLTKEIDNGAEGFGISGSSKMYFDILPEIKFTKATFYEIGLKHPILFRACQFTTRLYAYEKIINSKRHVDIPSLSDLGISSLNFWDRMGLIQNLTMYYPGHLNRGMIIRHEDLLAIEFNTLTSGMLKVPNRYFDTNMLKEVVKRDKLGYVALPSDRNNFNAMNYSSSIEKRFNTKSKKKG